MDKQRICRFLNTYAPPVLVILVGLILIFSPDSASALVAVVLGWGLLAAGILWLIVSFGSHGTTGQFLGAAVCILLGLWLIRNPLMLARTLGRLVGLLLIFWNVHSLRESVTTQGKVLSVLLVISGVILLLVPMTASRLAFLLLGAVVAIVGVSMLIERIRGGGNRLDSGDDNIIDAL